MKDYLTISEFAQLRGVNINSLLYYEKLGILKPAYVDPDTRYRYYAPEQLSTMDIILMCLSLDIPLKELKRYQDGSAFWEKKLLEDGRKIAKEKMRKMQAGLEMIEYSLNCQEEQDRYASEEGIYRRQIAPRLLIVEQYFGTLANITQFGRISTELFSYAERKGFAAVPPSGFMFSIEGDSVRQFLFYEVMPTDRKDGKIISIPGGNYSCMQVKFDPDVDHTGFIRENFGPSDRRIAVVSNMIRDRLQFNSRYNEIQVLDGCSLP
ncbi:MAG: MerR family transcriptional regulator [Clostridia bacterium]|nr:MerR family transcriptional regulator [Clostridia bacterium]